MSRSRNDGAQNIAVIGAGMAGLSCASGLTTQGHKVSLFDKGRGPGGRMSTRRFDTPAGQAVADHGAQYFTARDPAFASQVSQWEQDGIVSRWPEIGPDTWVGVPTMNTVIRHMASPHHVQWNSRVEGLLRTPQGWQLTGLDDDEHYDAVALAIPSEQALTFLAQHDFDMARSTMLARFQPCWTALFAFDAPLNTDTTFLRDCGAIGWAARESAKPGRSGVECWVVQASASWSAEHLEEAGDDVARHLQAALGEQLGLAVPDPIAVSTHRWRFAMSSGLGLSSLWNDKLRLGVCGDWLLGPRIECGWLSGQDLANTMARAPALALAS